MTTGRELASADLDSLCGSVRWRPDGKRLAAGGQTICTWNSALADEVRIHIPVPGFSRCLSLGWSADGRHLAVGGGDGSVTIHDMAGGGQVRILRGHGASVGCLCWHPHLPRLATSSWDNEVKIWDTTTDQELCTFKPYQVIDWSPPGFWSPDGLRLTFEREDGTLCVLDTSSADRLLEYHADLRDEVTRSVQEKNYTQALDTLKRLRELHPHEKAMEDQANSVEWVRATQLACDGQLDAAVAIFKQLSALAPDLPDYRLRLPWAMFEQDGKTRRLICWKGRLRNLPRCRSTERNSPTYTSRKR